jgi:hypothetical protein
MHAVAATGLFVVILYWPAVGAPSGIDTDWRKNRPCNPAGSRQQAAGSMQQCKHIRIRFKIVRCIFGGITLKHRVSINQKSAWILQPGTDTTPRSRLYEALTLGL